jgi:hypothetical protein
MDLISRCSIFFFQTDSIICGKSPYKLDDFLGLNETRTKGGYGLVGAGELPFVAAKQPNRKMRG